jgi:hypothetical protein
MFDVSAFTSLRRDQPWLNLPSTANENDQTTPLHPSPSTLNSQPSTFLDMSGLGLPHRIRRMQNELSGDRVVEPPKVHLRHRPRRVGRRLGLETCGRIAHC